MIDSSFPATRWRVLGCFGCAVCAGIDDYFVVDGIWHLISQTKWYYPWTTRLSTTVVVRILPFGLVSRLMMMMMMMVIFNFFRCCCGENAGENGK
jgi:membrane-bound metal-dependent hydrolase YbcI (DUF457 family)